MIQTDMDVLREQFYNLGKEGKAITGNAAEVFKTLDAWQRIEVINSYNEGKENV